MDSLNRHFLPVYGNDWVKTPNIDRFAKQSVIFDNHWIGSAPCMPARRDMLTGRLNFLERGWGSVEPFDVTLPQLLRQAGIYSRMETDHYHYFHVGGENYHTPFSSWALYRGQENDVYAGDISKPERPPEVLGKWNAQYARNKARFASDADYPTPMTFAGAADWLERNRDADDWFLWVEAFDPHEPFDCPQEFLDLYEDDWNGPHYDWSGYEVVEGDSPATQHLRKCYAATLTMTDKWFGRLLDKVEAVGGLEDTLIILTTDHGHMLGEHDRTGKNRWQVWNEMAHIPLLVHLPGNAHAGEHRQQLTQNIDIMPTLLEYFDVDYDGPVHGESWLPILHENAPVQRDSAVYGWFGQTVNLTDGKHTYFRAPANADNQPLYVHFVFPTSYSQHDVPGPDRFMKGAELGTFLPYTDCPVLRKRVAGGVSKHWSETMLYDIVEDHEQQHNLAGSAIETEYERLLVNALKRADAPPSQFERLGLSAD